MELYIIIYNMSLPSLKDSISQAIKRFGDAPSQCRHRPRSDRGKMRLGPKVQDILIGLLADQERPSMRDLLRALEERCQTRGCKFPSRASVYHFLEKVVVHQFSISDLPKTVQACLFNLDPEGEIPGHQLVFYLINYGELPELCYAAGMPWIDLYQALRLRGYRPKRRGLLEAIALLRRI